MKYYLMYYFHNFMLTNGEGVDAIKDKDIDSRSKGGKGGGSASAILS